MIAVTEYTSRIGKCGYDNSTNGYNMQYSST